jgi:hypothetical protein
MAPLGSLHDALQPWQDFFMLLGTAAATLTGLMFVALTFGSTLLTRDTTQLARAFLDPIYRHFGQVLLTACVVMMPVLAPTFLAALLILVGVLRLINLRGVFRQYREAQRIHRDVEASDWTLQIAIPVVCHLGLVATGVAFAMHARGAIVSLAVVTLVVLGIGIQGAWDLVEWMALAVNERRGSRDGAASPDAPADSAATNRSH